MSAAASPLFSPAPGAPTVNAGWQCYADAYSRDIRVQLPALIAIRRARIADLEACELVTRRGKARLYQHRRMLRSYEAQARRLGLLR